MTSQAKAKRAMRDGKERARYPTLERVLKNLRDRDKQILYTLYMARAMTTREISTHFWPTGKIDRGQTCRTCRNRLKQLRDWGLIEVEDESRVPASLVTALVEQTEGNLSPWGRPVVITNRGIQVLIHSGWIRETKANEAGEQVRAWQSASALVPADSQVDHAFMVSSAVLRMVGENWHSFRWWGSRQTDKVLHPENAILPDALLAGPLHTWAIEADKGSIPDNRLLERWEHQGQIWDQIRQHGVVMEERQMPTITGVLWFCSERTESQLEGRLWRLRSRTLAFNRQLPPSLNWYVDSFDGIAWTWRRWLKQWTLGRRPHPSSLLKTAVDKYLGPELSQKVLTVASLGNLAMWQVVRNWVAKSVLRRPGEKGEEWCVVLVRDELEAKGVWFQALDNDIHHRLILLVDTMNPDEPRIDLTRAVWRPEHEPADWYEVDLKDRITREDKGELIQLRAGMSRSLKGV